jgi:hypothetical protein
VHPGTTHGITVCVCVCVCVCACVSTRTSSMQPHKTRHLSQCASSSPSCPSPPPYKTASHTHVPVYMILETYRQRTKNSLTRTHPHILSFVFVVAAPVHEDTTHATPLFTLLPTLLCRLLNQSVLKKKY